MIKVVVIDDEELARKRLKKLLSNFSELEVIDEAENGEDAVSLINESKPDLVFLDIEMPVMNGFEVIQNLTHTCEIIFVTAYDQYAISAFEENALAYLLKPVIPEKLVIVMDRVKKLFQEKEKKPKLQNFFLSKIGSHIKFVPKNEVVFIQSKDKYTVVYDKNNEFIIDETLSYLENSIDDNFLRIHRSIIINVDFIESIDRIGNGKYQFNMNNNAQLESSASYNDIIKNRIGL